MLFRRTFRLLALLVLLAVPRAHAAPVGLHDPLARELKSTGDTAMEEGRYAEALDAYERATAIEGHPSLLYNRARALSALGRNAEALAHFEAFEREAPPDLLALVPGLAELVRVARAQVTVVELVGGSPGARVFVRGREIADLPLERPLVLDAGDAALRIVHERHRPFERTLHLTGGTSVRVDVVLTPLATAGLLRVVSKTRGAEVVVDRRPVGVVPVELPLEAGMHAIVLRHPDYRDAETRVVVRAEETKLLELELERRPAFYESAWFWSGVGLAIAGGVTIGIALSTERAPDRGDIDPGIIRTPAQFSF